MRECGDDFKVNVSIEFSFLFDCFREANPDTLLELRE